MNIKVILMVLAFANGVFMLLDGIHVLAKGKYIGPEKPGSWANLFYKFKIDVFKLGPLFITYGIAWLILAYGLWTNQDWVYEFGIIVSLLTLWYIKIGTIISLITVFLLLLFHNNIGL